MTKIKYSPEVADFIRSHTTLIPDTESAERFHYIPFWFKENGDGIFEPIMPDNLPPSVRNIILKNRENAALDQIEGRPPQPNYTG
jgi:hypothetical protein